MRSAAWEKWSDGALSPYRPSSAVGLRAMDEDESTGACMVIACNPGLLGTLHHAVGAQTATRSPAEAAAASTQPSRGLFRPILRRVI